MRVELMVWTDFGIPNRAWKRFASDPEARVYGEDCIRELGCGRYEIRPAQS